MKYEISKQLIAGCTGILQPSSHLVVGVAGVGGVIVICS